MVVVAAVRAAVEAADSTVVAVEVDSTAAAAVEDFAEVARRAVVAEVFVAAVRREAAARERRVTAADLLAGLAANRVLALAVNRECDRARGLADNHSGDRAAIQRDRAETRRGLVGTRIGTADRGVSPAIVRMDLMAGGRAAREVRAVLATELLTGNGIRSGVARLARHRILLRAA